MVWPSNRDPRVLVRSLTPALALCTVLLGWMSGTALAMPDDATNQKRLDKTVAYLQEAQNMNGGFGGNIGEESNQDMSSWVALALAAAGINPQDQAKPGGEDVYTYLIDNAAQALPKECEGVICTTGYERELLVADAAGTSPQDFGGINLVDGLLARRLPDGSFPYVPEGRGEVNDTVFAMLSLSLVQEAASQAAVQHAAEWLIGQQNSDGGWAWHNKGSASEADMTGAALQALVAAGLHTPEAIKAQSDALGFLHKIQDPDGGFPESASEHESNVASTAWATQGLWAVHEDPEAAAWTQAAGREPLDYLESMQQPDGHIRYRESEESNGVWMTAYVAPAFAGQPLPIPAVPRAEKGTPPSPGPGVLAGGGGDGAPLFSRPQPQSQGDTPGGVRLLSYRRKHAAHKSTVERHRNPGAPRKTPVPTTTTAAPESSAHQPVAGAGSTRSPTGTGSAATRAEQALSTPGAGDRQTGASAVKGVLIGAADPIEPGAPGLRSARVGEHQALWLAIGIGAAAALLALAGSVLERRRPQAIL